MLTLSLTKADVKGFEPGGSQRVLEGEKREAQKIPRVRRVALKRPPPEEQGDWAMGEMWQGQGSPWSD